MNRRSSIVYPALSFLLLDLILLLLVIFFRDSESAAGIFLLVSAILILMLAALFFYFRIYRPLYMFERRFRRLEKGEIFEVLSSSRNDELGGIESLLSSHAKRLEELIVLMNELGEGKIDSEFPLRSKNDELGAAISKLKESIIRSNKEAKERRQVDEHRNWAAQGLAKFGELMRNFNEDTVRHSNDFMKELVAYLDIEVGGFFLVREEENGEKYLALEGAYAFDREKQLQRRFDFGEGLVGRCAVEKESIVVTDVPKEYIKIRSGMGEDDPATIVFVPVLLDEKLSGVIELASFSEVPAYKIEFLESLGRSIAASVRG